MHDDKPLVRWTPPTVHAGMHIAGQDKFMKIVENRVSRLRAIITRAALIE